MKILFLSFLCFVSYLKLLHLQILTTLERSLNVPVRCKICLLKTHHDTVELAGRIEKTGVAAIAVHGRYRKFSQTNSCLMSTKSLHVYNNGYQLESLQVQGVLVEDYLVNG